MNADTRAPSSPLVMTYIEVGPLCQECVPKVKAAAHAIRRSIPCPVDGDRRWPREPIGFHCVNCDTYFHYRLRDGRAIATKGNKVTEVA